MPPIGQSYLILVALVPLFAAILNTRPLIGIGAGLLCGLAPAVLLANGLLPVPHPSPGEPNWIYAGYTLFGLPLAIMGGIASKLKELTPRRLLLLACVAVVAEACLMVVLPAHLALALYRFSPALRLASITGIWGASYVLWITNLALAQFVRSRSWPAVATAGSVVLLSFLPSLFPPPKLAATSLRIAVIQTQDTVLRSLATLNIHAKQKGASLAVWPELSGLVAAPLGKTDLLKKLSAHKDQPAFVTSFEDAATPRPHNAAALFSQGAESFRYYKRKPFGAEVTKHLAGDKAVAAAWEVPVGLNICFDSCYPSVLRETADLVPGGFIALPTEDPVSSGSIIQALHSAYIPFRSAELGMPLARADITAYSMITDSRGDILAEIPPGKGVAVAPLTTPAETVYREVGDWFLYLCALATAFLIVRSVTRRLKAKSKSP